MCSNSKEWVTVDQAALGMGLIVVPVYTNDRAENVSWIVHNAEVSLLVVESSEQWDALRPFIDAADALKKVVLLSGDSSDTVAVNVDAWLTQAPSDLAAMELDPDALATIVYTSGTTGKPKGVMLSHRNILWNIHACLERFEVRRDDVMLSFLPLSHMFERTVGYYLAMVSGTSIAFNRGIPLLADDLVAVKPTLMISVPRIFERVYGKITDKLAQESPVKQKLFANAVGAGWERHLHARGQSGRSLKLALQPVLDKLVGVKVREKLGVVCRAPWVWHPTLFGTHGLTVLTWFLYINPHAHGSCSTSAPSHLRRDHTRPRENLTLPKLTDSRGPILTGFDGPILNGTPVPNSAAHDKLGGRLRFTVCGGAALAPDIAKFFIGLGIPVTHGYGLTETSPVIAANKLEDNVPETVGPALNGVEIRVDERGELLTRSPSNMLGYWKNPQATNAVIELDGWLHTGDKVIVDDDGRVHITGRIKDIIVLATGEKVPPADMENAIALDSMFDQVI